MLYSRRFVRKLREAALSALRKNKDAFREYKRRRRRFNFSLRSGFGYFYAFLVVIGLSISATHEDPAFALTAVALYCTGTVGLRSGSLFSRLHWGDELPIFFGLPMQDDCYFSVQWKKFLGGSTWVILLVGVLYTLFALRMYPFWTAVLFAFIGAVLQWLVVVSLVLLTFKLRHPIIPKLCFAVYGLIIVAAFAPAKVTSALYPVTLALPAGWINWAWAGFLRGSYTQVLALLPVLALAALGISRYRILRSSFSPAFFHAEDPPFGVNLPGEDSLDEEERSYALRELDAPSGKDTFLENTLEAAGIPTVTSVAFEPHVDWYHAGFIERVAGTWLSEREKVTAEFMLGGTLGRWTADWNKALYITCATLVVARLIPATPLWILATAAVTAASMSAPLLGGKWPGFDAKFGFTNKSPLMAFFPLSYWQVSMAVFKVNLVRLGFYFVLLTPTFLVLSGNWMVPVGYAFSMLVRTMFWLTVLQIGAVIIRHSQGTNDNKTLSLATVSYFAFAIVGFVLVLLANAASLVKDLPSSGPLLLITFFSFVLAWWLYGILYNYGRIDLLRQPRS